MNNKYEKQEKTENENRKKKRKSLICSLYLKYVKLILV